MRCPGFPRSASGRVGVSFAVAGVLAASVIANTKPTGVPAQVVGHLALADAPGSEMLLQNKGDKHYLYVQKASKQGFTVINVTRPSIPELVSSSGASSTAGTLEMAGPDVAIAEVPDKNAKGVIRNTQNPTETINILDISDPEHPKVIQTFKGVTSILQDPGRGLIYLANNDGLWILRHPRASILPAKKKKECGSEDALSGMPPDCE